MPSDNDNVRTVERCQAQGYAPRLEPVISTEDMFKMKFEV